jgi:hypothetical protein
MDKKREEVYGVGIVFLIFSILLSAFTVYQVVNSGWGLSAWVLVIIDGVCGVFGIGSLLKPDTFGVIVLRLIENYQRSQAEGSGSSNRQTQKESNGSVQVNASDEAEVHVSVSPKDKKRAQKSSMEKVPPNGKVFSCPNGDRIVVFQPDDNHPKASLEEDYAKKYALGTVIPRKYKCRNCGSEFTLYWYQEGSGVGVL